MAFDLQDIRDIIRDVTSSPSQYQLTDLRMDQEINRYYQFVLPDDMKPLKTLVPYIFQTLRNKVEYPFDNNIYVSLEPEFFINGNRMLYYQDQSLWIRDFQYQYNQVNFASGDGVTTGFTTITNQVPIVPKTVIVTDGVENLTDPAGLGILVGSLGGSGTVDYVTGAISAIFFTAPPVGNSIIATWAPLIHGRPRAMYYNQGAGTIQFSPIPDQAYSIQGQAYIMPTALIAGGSGAQQVELQHWSFAIGYGTSLEIFRRRGQLDQLAMYQPSYDFYLDRAIGRTTQQLSSQRSVPKW